jgi:TRAP-type C4-dicarboxylate transport system permease large subunit
MLIMLLILIIAGCVMETTPNIVILAPLMMPLALEIGMNEIHFCIFMITSLGIGFITPPLGLNLFVVSGVTGTPTYLLVMGARRSPATHSSNEAADKSGSATSFEVFTRSE